MLVKSRFSRWEFFYDVGKKYLGWESNGEEHH